MLGRHALFVVLLFSALGVPYLSHLSPKSHGEAAANSSTEKVIQSPGQPQVVEKLQLSETPAREFASSNATLGPLAPVGLEEALDFRVTPGWLVKRWSRVTTGLADVELQGYRVAWISGTNQDDVAGSLTYYFTADDRLKRIIVHGTTGDPTRLVALLSQKFGFKRQVVSDASVQVYQVLSYGKPVSELEVRTAGMLGTAAGNGAYQIALAIDNPNLR